MRYTAQAKQNQAEKPLGQQKGRRGQPKFLAAIIIAAVLSGCAPETSTIQSQSGPAVSSGDESAIGDSADPAAATLDDASGSEESDAVDPDQPDDDTQSDDEDQQLPALELAGDPIPEGATVEQIKAVMEDAHGPTTNVAGQVNRLAPFPNVPTPLGADLQAMSVGVARASADDPSLRVDVTFLATGTVDDLVTFYETNLASFDWSMVAETDSTENGKPTKKLEYEYPGEGSIDDSFDVTITESDDGGTEVYLLSLASGKSADLEDLGSRHASWIGDAPVPDGGVTERWDIRTSNYVGYKLNLSMHKRYEDKTLAELRDYVFNDLPTEDYSLDEERMDEYQPSESLIYVQSDLFEDGSITLYEFDRSSGLVGETEIQGDVDFLPTN